jgi:hypothetical protein
MKKNRKQNLKEFDQKFDKGETAIDFSGSMKTQGMSKVFKLPPMDIPMWVAAEIDVIAKTQANSKAAVVRQLLVEALTQKKTA